MLTDIFYYIYVIHVNAFTAILYFLLINFCLVFLLSAMAYVFVIKNKIIDKETIRPVRRLYAKQDSAFNKNIQNNNVVNQTLRKEKNKLIMYYVFSIVMFLIAFLTTTRVVLFFGTAMWVVGAISVFLLKGDREEMANLIESQALTYSISLFLIHIVINMLLGVPAAEWNRALGVSLPSATPGTITGYLPMMFLALTIGMPMNYLRMVVQRYSITKNNKDAGERMTELIRTGNQNKLHKE